MEIWNLTVSKRSHAYRVSGKKVGLVRLSFSHCNPVGILFYDGVVVLESNNSVRSSWLVEPFPHLQLGHLPLPVGCGINNALGDQSLLFEKEETVKRKIFHSALVGVLVLALISCSRTPTRVPTGKRPPAYEVDGEIYHPLGEVGDYVERGVASWYGEDFHGRKTSSGEIYNMYARTAAHRILPFGTQVQVTNERTGKITTVRINDRGPFVNDRIIDLSYTGAEDIGLIGPGTAPVALKVVGVAEPSPLEWTGNFTVQIGAFEEQENAALLKAKLSRHHSYVHVTMFDSRGKLLYRVRVGRYQTLPETIEAQKELESRGYRDTFIVAE